MNGSLQSNLNSDYETLSLVDILGEEKATEFKVSLAEKPADLLVRGTLHRAGRAGFYHWHEKHREMLGWDEPAFRFSPVKKKIALGLNSICEKISMEKSIPIQLENLKSHWIIEVNPQPGSASLQSDYLAGFVQEFCSWAGLGKFYRVASEQETVTETDKYRIKIFKDPLDD